MNKVGGNMLDRVNFLKKFTVMLFLIVVFSMSLESTSLIKATTFEDPKDEKTVLYINSYHKGYKWSDDIEETIKADFSSVDYIINLETLYLDTQRISNNNPIDYYQSLANAIQIQYASRDIDLIMTSDDAAFEFVDKYLGFLDQEIPMLFCGVNETDKINLDIGREKGGVIEYLDIQNTIELIELIHPDIENIYYLADQTLTGMKVEEEILNQLSKDNVDTKFTKLDGKNLEAIEEQVRSLDDKSVILYTIYFYDNENKYYKYDEAIARLSDASAVPIYGLWEFSLGHGILGGKVLSGIQQGEVISKQAIEYFDNDEYEFTTIIDNNNTFKFDYEQLIKYGIDINVLPNEVDIINYSTIAKKKILVLHSYDQSFQWTEHIMDGIEDSLSSYEGNYEIYTEYMDLKRIDSSVYLYEYTRLFNVKHQMTEFDLIITSDDSAFNFAKSYTANNGSDVPIVFSGVNFLEPGEIVNHDNYSGVMEFYDLEKTLDLIVRLQPEVSKLLVINDTTITGKANVKNVDMIVDKYNELDIFQVTNLTMSEVVELVSNQKENTAILLMSFNRDRANNNFSYSESIRIIENASSVPIYGVWDFYLGDGVVGGYMTNGFEQGFLAGELGVKVLNGESPSNLDIITVSPNKYMVDMNQIEKYNISKVNIPDEAVIINEKQTLIDVYIKYKSVFNIILLVLVLTVIVVIVLSYFLRNSIKMNKRITQLANYDQLTNILNRREGIKRLKAYVTDKANLNRWISIVFMDINDLKGVNDKYGHGEGDDYIISVVEVINNCINDEDIFCRMGGDEFMVVLKDSEYGENGFEVSIKDSLEKLNQGSSRKYDLGISIGVYSFSVNPKIDVNKVIEAADTLMYVDKSNYKN